MSAEYLMMSDWEWCRRRGGLKGWADDETNTQPFVWAVPPMRENELTFHGVPIWAGSLDRIGTPTCVMDRQYIYNPKAFTDLSGGGWATFRKNIRKWPRRIGRGRHEYRRLTDEDKPKVGHLLSNWSVRHPEVFDPVTMIHLCLFGTWRWGLFVGDRLCGMNVADNNYRYINYRYCLDDGSDFIQEFLRYQFYTSDWTLQSGMLVNDGGDLDEEHLAEFKMKLRPFEVRRVFQYRLSQGEAR